MGEKITHISWKSLITFSIMIGIAGMIMDFAYEMLKMVLIYTKVGGLYEMKYTFLILRTAIIWIPISLMILFILIQISKGDWDMAYLKIIRHKLKEENYRKLKDSSIEISLYDITGINSNETKSFNSFTEIEDWSKKNPKGYLIIRDILVLAKDIHIKSNLNESKAYLKTSVYDYNGKCLLYNKNIKAYENYITDSKDAYDSDIEECAYIRKCFENRKFDLTIDGREELKNGIKKARFIGIGCALIGGLFVGMILYQQVYEKYLIENSTIQKKIGEITILFDKEPDNETEELIKKNLDMIPKEIKEEFVRKKWKIYIKSNGLDNDGFFFAIKDTSSVIAYTSTQLKLIVVSDSQKDIAGSIVHEFGHFIDSYKYTTTKEWSDIYNKEKYNYLRNYGLTSKFEGFACAFEEYIMYPDSFKEKCTETYKYIEKALSKYNK